MRNWIGRITSSRIRELEVYVTILKKEVAERDSQIKHGNTMYHVARVEREGYKKLTYNLTQEVVELKRQRESLGKELFALQGDRVRRQAVTKFRKWLSDTYDIVVRDGEVYVGNERFRFKKKGE